MARGGFVIDTELSWEAVLVGFGATERIIEQARKKIAEAEKLAVKAALRGKPREFAVESNFELK